jgi:twinkle protein
MTVVTGKSGEGKSTFLGQIALQVINNKHKVCFYSGELSARRFQAWIFSQAAGSSYMESLVDQFGETRWFVRASAEQKIRKWLGEKLVLYDNTKAGSSERNTIIKCFNESRAYYGSDLFFVDNLMTARYDIEDNDNALRTQANFAANLMDFARTNNVHVVLVAHPKKGEYADIKESVAGMLDITNMAEIVLQVRKPTPKDLADQICDSVITVAKNREYGDLGTLYFTFEKASKRFNPIDGKCITRYGWENEL